MGKPLEDVHRIEFDATLDEVVDAGLRLSRRSRAHRAQRARAFWVAGGCLAGTLLLTVWFRASEDDVDVAAWMWAVLVLIALTLGAACGYLSRRYYDWAVSRHYRRVVAEQLGADRTLRCEIELRPEGVWTVQNGLQMMFPWANAAGVEDTGDAVELRFAPGLVVARNRAFGSPLDRERFLARARDYATIRPA